MQKQSVRANFLDINVIASDIVNSVAIVDAVVATVDAATCVVGGGDAISVVV